MRNIYICVLFVMRKQLHRTGYRPSLSKPTAWCLVFLIIFALKWQKLHQQMLNIHQGFFCTAMNNMNLLEVTHADFLDGGADSGFNVEQLATKIMNFKF